MAAGFDGLTVNLGNLPLMSDAKTRSISPENITGEKGKGGATPQEKGSAAHASSELGTGWKVNPYVHIEPNQTFVMADIKGPGAIQHIWMTPTGNNRLNILRVYWDGEETPSIECPVGDFFAAGLGQYMQFSSLPVCVNPGSGFNCYWTMPFRKSAKITMTNIDSRKMTLYYQIDYVLAKVPKDAAYLHAQFRSVNPLPRKQVYTIIDGIKGKGQYAGTYMCWETKSNGWWGEGEIKFYFDGDKAYPTICGTGTEDYFCGSYNFEGPRADAPDKREYKVFNTPYTGLNQVIYPKGKSLTDGEIAGVKFGLYRWHITDPIRFEKELKVTIQALGWKENGIYQPLEDNISSVAFWYQTEPHAVFPQLKDFGPQK
ncbi:MAG: glycoside hydrolase family 172 protein [Phycisphaerae bacterium]